MVDGMDSEDPLREALAVAIEACSPPYRDLPIDEIIRRSKHGDAVARDLVDMARDMMPDAAIGARFHAADTSIINEKRSARAAANDAVIVRAVDAELDKGAGKVAAYRRVAKARERALLDRATWKKVQESYLREMKRRNPDRTPTP